jgi:hypothetical protein
MCPVWPLCRGPRARTTTGTSFESSQVRRTSRVIAWCPPLGHGSPALAAPRLGSRRGARAPAAGVDQSSVTSSGRCATLRQTPAFDRDRRFRVPAGSENRASHRKAARSKRCGSAWRIATHTERASPRSNARQLSRCRPDQQHVAGGKCAPEPRIGAGLTRHRTYVPIQRARRSCRATPVWLRFELEERRNARRPASPTDRIPPAWLTDHATRLPERPATGQQGQEANASVANAR